jgi:signal transduction histidine kinase
MEGLHADGHVLVAEVSALMVNDAQGRALCMMGTFVDITRRKEAESALRALNAELEQRVQARTAELALSEERYRTIFELVPVAIGEEDWSQVQALLRGLRAQGITDGPAYFAAHPGFVRDCMRAVRLLRMNRKMLDLHEARSVPEDFPTLEAVYGAPEFLPSFVEELEALWRGDRLYSTKKTAPTVKGRLLSLMLTMSLPPPEGGDGRALVSIVDISEIDRLNAELDASLARLKRINRELETFTYSVSHDLKAPLRGIDGYSRLLLRDHEASLDEEGKTFLANIRQASQQMGQLIDDLLAYSRLERRSLELGPLAVSTLVPQVLATFDEEIRRRGVHLRLDIPPELPAWGDAPGLQVALQNLVENALKFTRDAEHPAVTIAATDSGEGVVLSVQDNGPGFDMKFHDRIFDIFQRLHRAEDYPGTGVGLAIVRKAMERMGGRVWAESRPGAGATFHLQLPRMP